MFYVLAFASQITQTGKSGAKRGPRKQVVRYGFGTVLATTWEKRKQLVSRQSHIVTGTRW